MRKKQKREFEILSFFKSVSLKNPQSKLHYKDGRLFADEKFGIGLNNDCRWLKVGDLVVLFIDENDKKELDWNNNSILKDRLFITKGLSSSVVVANNKEYEFGYIYLLKSKISKAESYSSEKEISECIKLNSFKLSHVKLNAIKVRINILGEIIAKGEECF
jgi:hypothetical protein